MTAALDLVTNASWATLVRTMLHTLWQGAVIALLLWCVLRTLPARLAQLRYLAAAGSLAAVLLAGMVTWSVLERRAGHPSNNVEARAPLPAVEISSKSPEAQPGSSDVSAAGGIETPAVPIPWTTWAGWSWGIGAAALLLRTAVRASAAQRLAAMGRPLDQAEIVSLVQELAAKLNIRRTLRVRIVDEWRVPGVMGFVRPTLLLPASVLTNVPVWQLQMILAHELAHIRRWDYAVNFGQQVIEAILFFNPAVWWISQQVRAEREACCDAWAVRVTGSPHRAAQTLSAFVERVAAARSATWVLAYGDGKVLDRIKRILRPDRPPGVRAPWYTAAVALAVALLALAMLRAGTDVAVAAAERLLTPAERVDAVAQVQKEQQAADAAAANPPPRVVRGVVLTADGSPLPKGLKYVNIQSQSIHYTAGFSAAVARDGAFKQEVRGGEVQVVVEAPGFAPAFAGPFKPNEPAVCELVLSPGFDAQVKLTGVAGNAIPGARISAVYMHGFVAGQQEATTDAAGLLTLHHSTAAVPVRLTAQVPGYQSELKDVTLTEGKLLRWQLTPAAPTNGIVLDLATGRPIAGAAIRMVERAGYDPDTWAPNMSATPPLMATTGDNGRFVLDTLHSGAQYVFWVTAPKHGCELFYDIRPGQADLKWALGAERILRGRVSGDLSLLDRKRERGHDGPRIEYENGLHLQNMTYAAPHTAPVTIHDGVGTFEIHDPLPGYVDFRLGGGLTRVDTSHIPPLVELTAHKKQQETRTVIFRFDLPAGAPPPKGKLRVNFMAAGHYDYKDVPVEHGEARLDVPVPGKVSYSSGQELAGYWVKERPSVNVPAGKEPLVVTIPDPRPAGAVYGMIYGPDGQPASTFSVSAIDVTADLPAPQGWFPPQPFNSDHTAGSFVTTPLLLGRTYRFTASDYHAGAVISDPITLDDKAPVRELRLTFAPGFTKQVRILGPDGRPRAGVVLHLMLSTPFRWSAEGSARSTDASGTVTFEHVNPDIPGEYLVRVDPGSDYQGAGQRIVVQDGLVSEIKLAKGYTLHGRIVDVKSGKPLAHTKVTAAPEYQSDAPPRLPAETQTDAEGRFSFADLDSGKYGLQVEGAVPPDVVIEKDAEGRTTYRWPNGFLYPKVHGGQSGEVQVRVQVVP